MHALRVWAQYVATGWRVRGLAADATSRLALLYLAATTLLRSRFGRWGPVRLRIRLGDRVFPVALRTRTELDVLAEIGLDRIYQPARGIQTQTIVDLGANVGLATLDLLSSHPGARVIAVEADPALIPRLRENVAGLPVTVVNAAICAEDGARTLYRSDMNAWENSLERMNPTQETVQVPALTLDSLLDRSEVERVDLLKVDVEGAEWEIFAAGVPERVEAIIGEAHIYGGRDPAAFVDQLAKTMDLQILEIGDTQAEFLAVRR